MTIQTNSEALWGPIRLLVAGIFFIAIGLNSVHAAELKLRPSSSGKSNVLIIQGQIISGDAKKTAEIFIANPHIFGVFLDTPGGDVGEAIKIGEIVKMLRLLTKVEKDSKCMSACFFIWLGGASRNATGLPTMFLDRIGLHRPFLRSPANSESSLAAQANVVSEVTAYLESKQVPRRLIDLMMSRSSNDIYWLNDGDLEELGSIPPDLQELYLAKCGTDYDQLSKQRANAGRDIEKVHQIREKIDQLLDCQSDLNFYARADGIEKLKSGWLPLIPGTAKSKQDSIKTEDSDNLLIERVHPGWKKLVQTDKFVKWFLAQKPEIRILSSSGKTLDSIRLLDLYKKAVGTKK